MTQPNKKDALGKGIRSLLQNIDADLKTTAGNLKSEVVEQSTATTRIPLSEIEVNPKQPRHDFDENALSELAASLKLPTVALAFSFCHSASLAGDRVPIITL